jgi:hypothetical protein
METIIKQIRGDSLKATECIFCGDKNECTLFGIENGVRHDGLVLKHFGVCKEHLGKFNSLLSGEFDIDKINLEQYRKVHSGRGIRLR